MPEIRLILSTLCLLLASTTSAQEMNNPYLSATPKGSLKLSKAGASHFAKLALACLQQEYPNKLNQVLQDSLGLQEPKQLHPAFYGCFDWHSAVHGHWMLIRLLKEFPDLPEAAEIRKKLSDNLQAKNIAGEVAYLKTASKSWERMYGWAWLLKLSEELYTWDDPDGKKWYRNLEGLSDAISQKYLQFLPIQTYPVRTGVHPNTAFGLTFAWDYANTCSKEKLKAMIETRAMDYYLEDTNYPASWEPSGEDFLSAGLEEANLMSRILDRKKFNKWFKKFLPTKQLESLRRPADVSDRSDPKIVHLDGLNLSRAWCLYQIAPKVKSVRKMARMKKAANKHLLATIPNIATEHYEGSHWLASFAVYALSISD